MTHMRYWGMSIGVAISGALIAISRFAFVQTHAIWIVFGLAIAAAVLSLAAAAVALLRENHAFSGISALSALIAGFVVLATFAWQSPTSDVSLRWLAFGVGVAAVTAALIALVDYVVAISSDGASA